MTFRYSLACLGPMLIALSLATETGAQVVTARTPSRSSIVSSRAFTGGRVATLRDQLRAGLKVRRSVEFQFVENVVRLVDQGKLTRRMVLETFHYARKKPRGYPFQYFQRALALRAARIGVTIRPV